MKKRLFVLFAILLGFSVFGCTSCGSLSSEQTLERPKLTEIDKEKVLGAFVHVGTGFVMEICDELGDNCLPAIEIPAIISSSGSIIKSDSDGSVILTTGHSCREYLPKELPQFFPVLPPNIKVVLRSKFHISTTTGLVVSDTELINYSYSSDDNNLDICLLKTSSLKNQTIIPISHRNPTYGDRVYNIAAPLGIFYVTAVPFTDGFFSGNVDKTSSFYLTYYSINKSFSSVQSLYTFNATYGSSGSPIVNEFGELLAIVHSKNPEFDSVVYAISHENFVNYLIKFGIIPQDFPVYSQNN